MVKNMDNNFDNKLKEFYILCDQLPSIGKDSPERQELNSKLDTLERELEALCGV